MKQKYRFILQVLQINFTCLVVLDFLNLFWVLGLEPQLKTYI